METNGYLQAPVPLFPRKLPPLHIGWEVGCNPEAVEKKNISGPYFVDQ
jgi:hypothetical protein